MDLKAYEDTIRGFEQTVDTIEAAAAAAQQRANELHEKNYKPEILRSKVGELRDALLVEHKNALASVSHIAPEAASELKTRFSADSVMRRASLTNGGSLGSEFLARRAAAERLSAASDSELIGWAQDAADAADYGLLDEVRRASASRGANVRGEVTRQLAKLGPPKETQQAEQLAERANKAAQRANWAETRIRRLQAGRPVDAAATEGEALERQAWRVGENLKKAAKGVADRFFPEDAA